MTQHVVVVLQRKSTGEVLGIYTSTKKAEEARDDVPHRIHWDCELVTWQLDKAPES